MTYGNMGVGASHSGFHGTAEAERIYRRPHQDRRRSPVLDELVDFIRCLGEGNEERGRSRLVQARSDIARHTHNFKLGMFQGQRLAHRILIVEVLARESRINDGHLRRLGRVPRVEEPPGKQRHAKGMEILRRDLAVIDGGKLLAPLDPYSGI